MKITNINIPENFFDKGLSKISIDRLGDNIVIAGKNGSGKTRLLDLIYECVNKHILTNPKYYVLKKGFDNNESKIKNFPDSPKKKDWYKNLYEIKEKLIIDSYFKLDRRQDNHIAIRFVPNNLVFTNPDTLSKQQVDFACNEARKYEKIEQMNDFVLAYIQREADNCFRATHQSYENNPESIALCDSFERFNDMIFTFLGTRIIWNFDHCTIFGRDIGNACLSDGQKVLLQLCVLIHAQGATLDNLILILDEPENHLHPEAQIEFIKKTKEVLKNGQIWIATHSIHILSYFNTSDAWYMNDGNIKYAGKDPEKILYGLLGGENNIDNLQTFLASPAIFAANQFAYECLFAPGTVMTGPEDKQTTQIAAIIERFKDDKGKVVLLDYGAGKGRLLSSIMDNQIDPSTLHSWMDYTAFDEYPDDKTICENAIARVYGDGICRYFNSKNELLRNRDIGSFDIVVMCNVLHEISPKKWLKTFERNSLLDKLLSENGYLLIVEDNIIPFGEQPNEDGFFILGGTELKDLFSMSADGFISTSVDNGNRLFAHLIPRKNIRNITNETIRMSLKTLHDNCCEMIKCLRGKTDYRSGRLLGLWLQQLANVILYLN